MKKYPLTSALISRMPTKSSLFLFFISFSFLFVFSGSTSSFFLSPAFASPIKIGVSTALSGEGAIYGQDMQDFFRFANHDIANDAYELIFEDDKCEGKGGLSAAKKLVGIDKISYALGFACSSSLLVPANTYSKAKIVTIATYASSPRIRDLGEYIFRTFPNDAEAGKLLRRFIDQQHHSKVALLSEESDYTQDLKNALLQGSTIRQDQFLIADYLPGTTDFRSLLISLKQKKVDALFINTPLEQSFGIIVKLLFELNWHPALYGAYWPGSPSLQELLGSKLDGIIYVDTPSLKNLLNPEGKQILDRFKQWGGKIRSTEATFATSYEAFRALHLAISSGKDVKKYLSTASFDGLFGKWHFDSDGEIQGINLVLKKHTHGADYEIDLP